MFSSCRYLTVQVICREQYAVSQCGYLYASFALLQVNRAFDGISNIVL